MDFKVWFYQKLHVVSQTEYEQKILQLQDQIQHQHLIIQNCLTLNRCQTTQEKMLSVERIQHADSEKLNATELMQREILQLAQNNMILSTFISSWKHNTFTSWEQVMMLTVKHLIEYNHLLQKQYEVAKSMRPIMFSVEDGELIKKNEK